MENISVYCTEKVCQVCINTFSQNDMFNIPAHNMTYLVRDGSIPTPSLKKIHIHTYMKSHMLSYAHMHVATRVHKFRDALPYIYRSIFQSSIQIIIRRYIRIGIIIDN